MSTDDRRVNLDDFNSVPDMTVPEIAELPGRYPLTDVGNADRFADRYGQRLRYCAPWSKWLCWDGRRWSIDDTVQVENYADLTVRAILDAAKQLPQDHEGRRAMMKHAVQSQRAGRIRSIPELARSRPGIPVLPNELDDQQYALNVLNGTLDLEAMNLRDHNRHDLLTKLAPVRYDPDAECFRWSRFVDEIFCGDTELIEYVQRACGYSLTGDTGAQVFFLLHGTGENGKSTFLETIRSMLGSGDDGYAKQAAPRTFIEHRNEGIPNDVARLRGSRFVTAIETGENRRLDETLVKQMTGGDTLTARFLRAEFFEFEPHFKVWLATNHKPNIKGTDHALWRRIRLIPFNATFSKGSGSRDDNLKETLRGELPGILNWCLTGLSRYMLGHNLDEAPQSVIEATAAYRTEEDVLGRWIDECTAETPTGRTAMTDLYAAYQQWCVQNGERPETKNKLGRMLAERGYDSMRSSGNTWRLGIELVDADVQQEGGW